MSNEQTTELFRMLQEIRDEHHHQASTLARLDERVANLQDRCASRCGKLDLQDSRVRSLEMGQTELRTKVGLWGGLAGAISLGWQLFQNL